MSRHAARRFETTTDLHRIEPDTLALRRLTSVAEPETEPVVLAPTRSRLRRTFGAVCLTLSAVVFLAALVSAGAWLGYAYGLGSSAVVVCPVDQR